MMMMMMLLLLHKNQLTSSQQHTTITGIVVMKGWLVQKILFWTKPRRKKKQADTAIQYTPLTFLGKGVGGNKTHRQQTGAEGRETDRQTDRMTRHRDRDTDRQTDRDKDREKGARWEDGYKNSQTVD